MQITEQSIMDLLVSSRAEYECVNDMFIFVLKSPTPKRKGLIIDFQPSTNSISLNIEKLEGSCCSTIQSITLHKTNRLKMVMKYVLSKKIIDCGNEMSKSTYDQALNLLS